MARVLQIPQPDHPEPFVTSYLDSFCLGGPDPKLDQRFSPRRTEFDLDLLQPVEILRTLAKLIVVTRFEGLAFPGRWVARFIGLWWVLAKHAPGRWLPLEGRVPGSGSIASSNCPTRAADGT